jgi:branched-chain amino acid aminotransferase
LVKETGYIDGEIDDLQNTRIPIVDRGFLYGDSVYEVFRTYSGIPFLFEEHYQRLLNSARLIQMNINQSKEDIIVAVKQTVLASAPSPGEDVYVRYQITRGEGPIDLNPEFSLQTRLIVIVKAVPLWKQEFYDTGMILAVPRLHRNSVNSLDPNIKGGNYLNNIIALGEAKNMGADDCLMLDANGLVTECSNSNVWFVLDGKLVTPAGGNLDGLTRQSLVSLCEGADIEVVQRPVHSEELPAITECFVTSATREVMPVCLLYLTDGRKIELEPGGGEMTRLAMSLYKKMLQVFISKHHGEAWI